MCDALNASIASVLLEKQLDDLAFAVFANHSSSSSSISLPITQKKNRLIAFSCQVFGYVLVKEREKGSKSRHLHFLMLLFFDENEYKIAVQTLKK